MCNVSSSFSFFPIRPIAAACSFFSSEMHFHFWSRSLDSLSILITVIHMLELGLDLIRLAFSRATRMASLLLAFHGKKALCERDPRMNAISPFLISRSIFPRVFYLRTTSRTACCWRQGWCTFAHKEMSLFFYPIQRRHTQKKVCSTLLFSVVRCSMALFKGFFLYVFRARWST